MTARAPLRLAYLVHDLNDPAVARRLEMLRPHLAAATVIGFHRAAMPPATVAGFPTVAIGHTADARLGQRALAVMHAWRRLSALREVFQGANAILARQLEALLLARAARDRFCPAVPLLYELLDVHRLLVATSPPGVALRAMERRLIAASDGVVVSSPAFVREHLVKAHGAALPTVCLMENKVLGTEADTAPPAAPPAGPPWRIGWFGMLRCRQSLLLLAELVRRLPGQVEVRLHGRPALAAIPDFDQIVAAAPGLSFHGPYDRARDLAQLYREVHFSWAIDWYETGANSDWLLPNRLYEGSLHGAVPIALAAVETGRWLAQRGAGVLLGATPAAEILDLFSNLDPVRYAAAAARVTAIPRSDLVDDGADGARLAEALRHRR